MIILFMHWRPEKPENKKRFEDVRRKNERKKEKEIIGR